MRITLRADAGRERGTGHVMRCLTLAEELLARGFVVDLITNGLDVGWLRDFVDVSGVVAHRCATDSLSLEQLAALRPDWLVVDSYDIPAKAISLANEVVPTLAIVDGSNRGISAKLYLDQNLGASPDNTAGLSTGSFLTGVEYALVRSAVLAGRRPHPWILAKRPPRVVSFMGGTDPFSMSKQVARAFANVDMEVDLVMVAPSEQHNGIRAALPGAEWLTLRSPTPDLPALLSTADLVISAAGTSAWDVCTLAVPSILVAVVDNQVPAIGEINRTGVAIGVDATAPGLVFEDLLPPLLQQLLVDFDLRRELSEACSRLFDGMGKRRVVDRMMERSGRA